MDLPRRITAQALVTLILLVASEARGDACADLRARLDAAPDLDPRHVRSRVVPWLRRDPFLAAELARAGAEGGHAQVILETMAALELRALRLDPRWSGDALEQARRCGQRAVATLAASPGDLRELIEEPLPELYLGWRRTLGGYVLARPFLRAGAARWRARERAAIAAGLPDVRSIHRPADAGTEEPTALAALLRTLRERHPLAWPAPDAETLQRLGRAFAPELATSEDRPHTRIGALAGRGSAPVVDTGRPRAYLDHGFVRWGEQVLLQLSFTFWFTERPLAGPFDPYGGPVDGLVLRVTVADDGRALVWESIHPCGCFYTVAIPEDRSLRFLEGDPAELEAPLMLSGPAAAQRPRVYYSPEEHYLRALTPAAGHPPPGARIEPYRLEPYEALLEGGPDRPPFDAGGILRGSERGERLFLWPSGIRSPGTMRSAGRQATAFLGRRRFDEADLLGGRLRKMPRKRASGAER